jgi:hypothetical protein
LNGESASFARPRKIGRKRKRPKRKKRIPGKPGAGKKNKIPITFQADMTDKKKRPQQDSQWRERADAAGTVYDPEMEPKRNGLS